MIRYSALLAIAGLAACATPPSEQASGDVQTSPLAADQAEPLLALVDHLLDNYFASDVARRPTICASVHDGRSEVALSPEAELALMTRYDALAPFARCAWIDDAWQDSETQEAAIVFNVHSFTCASDAQCSGFGGYIAGQTSSLSNRYSMDYADGTWNFTQDPRLVGEE